MIQAVDRTRDVHDASHLESPQRDQIPSTLINHDDDGAFVVRTLNDQFPTNLLPPHSQEMTQMEEPGTTFHQQMTDATSHDNS